MEAIRNEATVKVECPRKLLERFAEALPAVEGVFEQREAAALTLDNGLLRQWIERDLDALAQGFGDEVSVDGLRYRRTLRAQPRTSLTFRPGIADASRRGNTQCYSSDFRTWHLIRISDNQT
jgi:hypothetical protein